jgi:hypothetical protein
VTTRRVALTPAMDSVREARLVVRETLHDCGIADTELAELATSELVSNAVRHGEPPVVLVLRCAGRMARVEVHDGSAVLPRLGTPGGDAGNGLVIVDAFTPAWGADLEDGGKSVWFQFGGLSLLRRRT